MSNFPNLDFALGETADMIRDTTQRFSSETNRALGRQNRRR